MVRDAWPVINGVNPSVPRRRADDSWARRMREDRCAAASATAGVSGTVHYYGACAPILSRAAGCAGENYDGERERYSGISRPKTG